MSRRTQDRVPCGPVDFAYGDFTLSVGPSQTLRLSTGFLTARGRPPNASYNPTHGMHAWFGLFPLRSPLLGESRLISLPAGT